MTDKVSLQPSGPAAQLSVVPELLSKPPRRETPQGDADDPERLRQELERWRDKAIALDKHVFEMRSLLQSGKGFSEILNIDHLLDAIMAVCRERYGSVTSTVLLLDDLDPDNIFYRVRAHHGLPPSHEALDGGREETVLFRIPQDQGLLWQLIYQGDVFSVRDMQKMPRFETAFRQWNLGVLCSDVWVPLMRGSTVLGLLTLGECADGSQIPESEYAFLQEIAAVAATNIDSTLKYEKNERILNNLRTLYDVNQQLANVNDFKRLMIETLSTAVRALKAQKANLMLLNPETNRLEIKVVWGNIPTKVRDAINNGSMKTKTFAVGVGVAGQAARLRQPVRINDRTRIEQVGRYVAYCILAAPLLYGGRVVGVMTLTNKIKTKDGRIVLDPLERFGADDEQLLLGLADQAAVNLHKARLYSASITDRLTGLYNTRHFERQLDEHMVGIRTTGLPLSLAVIDIDDFKKLNDTHGHKAGDATLAAIARCMRQSLRAGSQDLVFRYGGEEFCLLMPGTTGEAAVEACEVLRNSIEMLQIEYESRSLSVTVSIGVAQTGQDLDTRVGLFEAADKALYASKQAGKNQVTLHA